MVLSLWRLWNVIKKWWVIPEISFVSQFYDHEFYLKGFEEQGNKHNLKNMITSYLVFTVYQKDM